MKPFIEAIPLKTDRTYIVREFHSDALVYPIHQHPQYEISYVIKGEGTRIVGDHVGRFLPGDLVLVGPNLPHRWISDTNAGGGAHNIIIQIENPFMGQGFLEKEEMLQLKQLFDCAAQGVLFTDKTSTEVGPLIRQLVKLNDFEGVMKLLEIFFRLAIVKDARVLAGKGFFMDYSMKGSEQINAVFNYLFDNYRSDVSMDAAARIAKMTKSNFAHFFKKRTNKHFSDFVSDLRISHAVLLLLQTQLDISEICYQCGFNNLSYFNRKFLERYGISPRQYRNTWQITNS